MQENVDFSDIQDAISSEDLEGATPDFTKVTGFRPMDPGRYLSRSRSHAWAKTSKGKPSIKINFGKQEAFETLKGEPVKAFPPFETLYFHKNKVFETQGSGAQSAVSAYLSAAKLKSNNWEKDELQELVLEADTVPMVVIIGWEQDYKEVQARQEEDPSYKPKKTSFFKTPSGGFVHQKKDDEGFLCTARAKVVGYEVFNG